MLMGVLQRVIRYKSMCIIVSLCALRVYWIALSENAEGIIQECNSKTRFPREYYPKVTVQ